MKEDIKSGLFDRRFILGAAAGATAGGAAVALLEYLDVLGISDARAPYFVRHLRKKVTDDNALFNFATAASEAVRQHAGEWSDGPYSAADVQELSIEEIRVFARDDYKNDRTLHVSGWIISRTEALLLTLVF